MKRILYYMQHLMGVGHVFRAMRIARQLVAAGHEVDFIFGGEPVPNFDVPGARIHYLPPLRAGAKVFRLMETPDGTVADEAYRDDRRDRILSIFENVQPDALIIETFPLGRRQMRFELLPLLDAARADTRKPVIFSSIRDILQENWKPERYGQAIEYVDSYFDYLLIHGDQNFMRLEFTFPQYDRIADKIIYTGLVAPDDTGHADVPENEKCDVVVSVGGGVLGKELLEMVFEAREMSSARDLHWLVIHGINMDADTIAGLKSKAGPDTTLIRFSSNLLATMREAQLSISRCGYNTVADIFRSGTRAIVVPATGEEETEQVRRAEVLKRLGLAGVVLPEEANPQTLARCIDETMAKPVPDRSGFDLDGAMKTAEIVTRILEGRGEAA